MTAKKFTPKKKGTTRNTTSTPTPAPTTTRAPLTRDEHLAVAAEILNQLGGKKFGAMVGICNIFAYDSNPDGGVQFDFKGSPKANRCIILLDPADTYTVRIYKRRGIDLKLVDETEGAYNDMLQNLFTSATGLDCTL